MAGFDDFPDYTGPAQQGAGRFATPQIAASFDAFPDYGAAPKIDFNRPPEQVRADLAKLQGPEREQALKDWADSYVADERKNSPISTTVDDTVRTLARGSFVGPFLDEATAATQAGLNKISGGYLGTPYDEAVAYQRARDRAVDESSPILSTVGKLAGGVAGGVGALRQVGRVAAGVSAPSVAGTVGGMIAGGPLATVAPAASMTGKIAQGAGVGATYGGVAAAGNAEGDMGERLDAVPEGMAWGAALGGALPPVLAVGQRFIYDPTARMISPTVARYGQNFRSAVGLPPKTASEPRLSYPEEARPTGFLPPAQFAPQSAGAAAVPPAPTPPMPPPSGASAAADQTLANQLVRAGVDSTDLRQRLAQQAMARGNLPNSTALADLDPSLQRLAGSVQRFQPEAGNIARGFIQGRQTGLTPEGGMPQGSGIPTRPMMTPEVPGRPMGQFERFRERLREYLDIPAGTARQQEGALAAELERNARPMYRQTYTQAQGLDMRPTMQPLMTEWRNRVADQVDPLIARQLNAAVNNVERALTPGRTSSFERLNSAKISIDEMIDRAMRSQDRRSPNLARLLTEIKRELVDTMDSVPGVGEMYRNARGMFSTNREMQNALELGRQAFREGAEVTAEQYAALTPGQQRMFRTGLFESFEQNMGGRRRNNDLSQVFESPRIQEILQVVAPRGGPQQSGPVGQVQARIQAERPQQFGRFVQTEKGYIGTRNEVLGNSKTAERLQDDQALNSQQTITDTLRSAPTNVRELALKAFQAAMNRLFGFRADTAAEIARRLFTADEREISNVIAQIEQRMGPSRAAQFRTFIDEYNAAVMQATAAAQSQPQPPGRRLPPPSPPQGPNPPPMPRPPTRPTQP